MARAFPITESGRPIGTICRTDRGFEAWSAAGSYLATFPSLASARRALRELAEASQATAFAEEAANGDPT